MSFTYWLPDEQGNKQIFETSTNSVVIVGANGSGKSKLGAWIEQQDFEKVHRIGAQRNLNFNENISLKSYSQAEDLVLYGSNDEYQKRNKNYRWDRGQSYTTKLLDDFENVLAALLAMKNNENDSFILECKEAERVIRQKPQTPITAVDRLQNIWNEVFPQRELKVEDSKFYAILSNNENIQKYPATQMSDGERAVLYLASQVICVPKDKILIIDEPEIHLHRSIMNRLWSTLESYRPDCLFIYITHDTDFSATHSNEDKIWIREYNGNNWKLEKINNNELPEDLLLNILGSRKSVLFVEGEQNSYDTQLYSELYPQYQVIACGGCSQVISRTKVFKNNPSLHKLQVYGIIDRDFRSQHEMDEYQKSGIFTIEVAEVDNLFLVEEVVRFLAIRLARDPDDVFESIKDYVIKTKFKNQINGQICKNVVAEIKYRLSGAELSMKNDDKAKESLNTLLGSIDYEQIKSELEEKFISALKSNEYSQVIRVFNKKDISTSVGHFFGLENAAYCSTIVSLLKTSCHDEIVSALKNYIPSL